MDELLETVTTAENPHESFRVWITTEAHNQFPISLLQVRQCDITQIFMFISQMNVHLFKKKD